MNQVSFGRLGVGARRLALLLAFSLGVGGCPQKEVAKDEKGEAAKASSKVIDVGDLSLIKRRGVLRVGVFAGVGTQSLARAGSPAAFEREAIALFASQQDLKVETVRVEAFASLFTALQEGRIDLAASRITITPERAEKVAFTRPLKVVDEVVVGHEGGPAPKKVGELSGLAVSVRPGSSYAGSLQRASSTLEKAGAAAINVLKVETTQADEQIVHRVAEGSLDLSVIDSDQLAAIVRYEPRAKALFKLTAGRQIAWAVRQSNPKLLNAADAFLIARALTGHRAQIFTGDLDGIKKRQVLRVLTRNNGVTYYLHRGMQFGFEYELSKKIAQDLGVRLEMVVPPTAADLATWLLEGRGDIIAASWSVTPERAKAVHLSSPYLYVDEVLVGKAGAAGNPTRLEELKGKTVTVRPQTSYARTLAGLQAAHGPFTVTAAPADQETEKILGQVAEGEVALTVADSHILAVEQAFRPSLRSLFKITIAEEGAADARGRPRTEAVPIVFGLRKDATQFQSWVDAWIKKNYRGLEYNVLRNKYFRNQKRALDQGAERAADAKVPAGGRISPYDDLIKKYATQYHLDWRLLAAQAYQESRFDPKAKSWVGAKGLFQVMPATGKEMGFTDLENPDIGTHAGVRYMNKMMSKFEDSLPLKQRVRFALASYNAGRGHVIDARRLARQKGWDANRWFGNVERAMLLLQEPRYAKKARHGYCRGREPVQYVSKIQSRYDAYVSAFPGG